MENIENMEDTYGKRQLVLTVVIGLMFMLGGEPLMASCSAGFLAGAVSLVCILFSIGLVPGQVIMVNTIIVLVSGVVFNSRIAGIQSRIRKALCASAMFCLLHALSLILTPLLCNGNLVETLRSDLVYFLVSSLFFIIFVFIKVFLIDRILARN